MAVFALTDAAMFMDGFDLSCVSNNLQFDTNVAELNVTTFCSSGWDEHIGGLKTATLKAAGFWEGDGVDAEVFDNIGVNKTAMTVTDTGTAGTTAFVFQPTVFDYNALGQIGEAAPFDLTARSRDAVGVARGQLIAAKQNISATGALTGYQVGALSAGQTMYVAVHVFSAGTTITFDIESDDNSGFTTATSRATIGALTAAGGTWDSTITGAITDDWWRVNVTAATGTFSIAVAVGIA